MGRFAFFREDYQPHNYEEDPLQKWEEETYDPKQNKKRTHA